MDGFLNRNSDNRFFESRHGTDIISSGEGVRNNS